ncbi:putative HNHc nuclease [Enterococcus sp. 5H]|uniref:putative HNHc nuclease n=1 Tax=Enterococcus sp. 5H TaxID=1229490 RepID=UPI002304A1B5|nr:putative HNHc nuclease [Enterococcus sp. 5H]MDA9472082.1 hypothetical protein [Enterococcus sp. 5H]
MDYSLKVVGYDEKTNTLQVQLDETLNLERLNTYYKGDLSNVLGSLTLSDPRSFTHKQRALYWALLKDIYNHFGNATTSSHKEFKKMYQVEYDQEISTKNNANTSVEQMNKLIEIVIDFMFEWDVPFEKGFELLPRNESYFYYLCLKHRKCCICGKHADICHADVVGSGRNRKKIDHSELRFYAGCRGHHQEEHTIGINAFLKKYNITPIKLNYEERKKLKIGG